MNDYLQKLQTELRFYESRTRADGTPFFPHVIADRKRRIQEILKSENESDI